MLSDTATSTGDIHLQSQEQSQDTSTSDYPLAMRREVRQFFNELGVQIDPETSLPRFTPEELAEKQPASAGGSEESGTSTGTSTTSATDARREGLNESMGNLTIV